MSSLDHWDDTDPEFTSRAEKKKDLLPFGVIGGVGQFVYHNFRFTDYRFEPQDNGDTIVVPILDSSTPLDAVSDEKLDGNRILTGLFDLAKKIDSFDTKENCAQLIVQWCVDNMHPYDLDTLYTMLVSDEKVDDLELMSSTAIQDGTFSLRRFIKDLGCLYNAVRMKMALDCISIGEEDLAYNLYCGGRFYEAPSYFEKYKTPEVEIPDDLIPDSLLDEKDGLIRAMEIEQEYIKAHPPVVTEKGHFVREPFDGYEELRSHLFDMFPDFKLRLKADPADGKVALAAVVDSVFDIAWYALAHLITEEPTLADLGRRDKNLKGIMETCRNCGRLFIRYNSRNHYCDNEKCQKARNAQNQRAFRQRRAARKTQSKDQPASAENA